MKTVTFAGFTETAKTNKAAMAKIEQRILDRFVELKGPQRLLFVTDTGKTWETTLEEHERNTRKKQTAPAVAMMAAREVLYQQGQIVSVHTNPRDIEIEYQAGHAISHPFSRYPQFIDPAIPRVRCVTCGSVWLDDGKNKGCTNPACEDNPALDESWRKSHRIERERHEAWIQNQRDRAKATHYTVPLSEMEFNTRWNAQHGVVETDRKLSRVTDTEETP